jgi:hypothetical protein
MFHLHLKCFQGYWSYSAGSMRRKSRRYPTIAVEKKAYPRLGRMIVVEKMG